MQEVLYEGSNLNGSVSPFEIILRAPSALALFCRRFSRIRRTNMPMVKVKVQGEGLLVTPRCLYRDKRTKGNGKLLTVNVTFS